MVIVSAAFTVNRKVCTTLFDTLSRNCTVKLLVPALVGVPVTWPSDANVSPAGTEPPVTDHVYGGAPPDAASLVS